MRSSRLQPRAEGYPQYWGAPWSLTITIKWWWRPESSCTPRRRARRGLRTSSLLRASRDSGRAPPTVGGRDVVARCWVHRNTQGVVFESLRLCCRAQPGARSLPLIVSRYNTYASLSPTASARAHGNMLSMPQTPIWRRSWLDFLVYRIPATMYVTWNGGFYPEPMTSPGNPNDTLRHHWSWHVMTRVS